MNHAKDIGGGLADKHSISFRPKRGSHCSYDTSSRSLWDRQQLEHRVADNVSLLRGRCRKQSINPDLKPCALDFVPRAGREPVARTDIVQRQEIFGEIADGLIAAKFIHQIYYGLIVHRAIAGTHSTKSRHCAASFHLQALHLNSDSSMKCEMLAEP